MSQTTVPILAEGLLVKKTVVVNTPRDFAFTFFTERFVEWWPLGTHHIGREDAQTAIMEPFAGGRWFERGVSGTECDWGRVLVWEPPSRVVLAWQLTREWQFDATFSTEVEVTFTPKSDDVTIVTLEHRQLEKYGEYAQQVIASVDSEGGWTGIMQRFADEAAKARG